MATFDREKARDAVIRFTGNAPTHFLLDALAACVTDEPQTIDRDALIRELANQFQDADDPEPLFSPIERTAVAEYQADRVLALLRPDPRIARLEALAAEWDEAGLAGFPDEVRAILRGES